MKKVVKILYVVNGCNLDWPTYAATLRLRQNFPFLRAKKNQSELPEVKQTSAYVGQTMLYFLFC